MNKTLITLMFVFFYMNSFTQGEGNNWYFGFGAGVSFNTPAPSLLNDGQLFTAEGCSTMSDSEGNLLFYSDGSNVYNSNHDFMPNGNGLFGSITATESSFLVEKPGSTDKYYVFTMGPQAGLINGEGFGGLAYSIVDMSLEGGLGDVTNEKNIEIIDSTCEKVTASPHENGEDMWIITKIFPSGEFHSYLLSEDGITTSPIISPSVFSGSIVGLDGSGTIGQLKASSSGDLIVSANQFSFGENEQIQDGFVEVYKFNQSTGELTDSVLLENVNRPYGVEFSAAGRFLYVSTNDDLEFAESVLQYDLIDYSSDIIESTRTVLISAETSNDLDGSVFGALQLAPNQKIYLAHNKTNTSTTTLAAINNPDAAGLDSNFDLNAIPLTGSGYAIFGLPNFYNNYLFKPSLNISFTGSCIGSETIFELNYNGEEELENINWNFGDPNSNSNLSNEENPNHLFSEPGTFLVQVTAFVGETELNSEVSIIMNETPDNTLEEFSICNTDSVLLDATLTNGSYLWSTGSTNPTIEVNETGTYSVILSLNNCISESIFNVTDGDCEFDIDIPNVFSPNNDNFNDLFKPFEEVAVNSMSTAIFNRWGQKIFETNNPNINWDGGEYSEGVYFWVISITTPGSRKIDLNGSVTLIR